MSCWHVHEVLTKSNISNHFFSLSQSFDRSSSSHYDKDLCLGYFNSEIPEAAIRNFYDL